MTLLELTLALVVTSLTGLAVAAVTTSVARGLTGMNEVRSALQRAHAAHVRLRSFTDPALALLEADDPRGFALWAHDDRPNGAVNLSEIVVVWVDPEAAEGLGELTMERVSWPEAWDEGERMGADLVVTSADDPLAEIERARSQGHTVREVLADGIAGFAVSHSAVTADRAARFRVTLEMRVGTGANESLLMAFGLANHTEPS